jgi:hypothetical protein
MPGQGREDFLAPSKTHPVLETPARNLVWTVSRWQVLPRCPGAQKPTALRCEASYEKLNSHSVALASGNIRREEKRRQEIRVISLQGIAVRTARSESSFRSVLDRDALKV